MNENIFRVNSFSIFHKKILDHMDYVQKRKEIIKLNIRTRFYLGIVSCNFNKFSKFIVYDSLNFGKTVFLFTI